MFVVLREFSMKYLSVDFVKKESVESICLSERRLWKDLNTNKQYPTLVLSMRHRRPQTKQYEVTSVLPSLCSENFHIFVQG